MAGGCLMATPDMRVEVVPSGDGSSLVYFCTSIEVNGDGWLDLVAVGVGYLAQDGTFAAVKRLIGAGQRFSIPSQFVARTTFGAPVCSDTMNGMLS